MGVTGAQTKRKVRSQAIVYTEGKASGVNVIAGCIGVLSQAGRLGLNLVESLDAAQISSNGENGDGDLD